jgi:PIN domain nuclease of toxin-antitoxin system
MLLDTHALLWLLADDPRLGPQARELISKQGNLHVSAASLWEIAIKAELGKLTVPEDLPSRIVEAGLSWLPVAPEHAWATRAVAGLPHRDPFDRLIIAQADAAKLALLTADQVLLRAELEPAVRLLDARN